jgi:alanine racemase
MLAELRIDLDAIRRNVAVLQALAAPARVVPVIKSNAYGHGLTAVAAALAPTVPRFAVYELAEAVALRAAGIATPIHVLGPVPAGELDAAHAARAELTLWDDAAYAMTAANVARRHGGRFRIHAKIDTGVARLGMRPVDAPRILAHYAATPEFELAGVFSHLAAAEELDSTFTHEQLALFRTASAGCPPEAERHIAATAAAMLWPDTRLDAVRTGIGIYGLWPSPETEAVMRKQHVVLEPALSWRTEIVTIHAVPAHTPVGYGCAYHTKRPSRIAVLPIGYAEGLPRSAGDRAAVLVDGRRCRVVGRICMNMSFVDVTEVESAIPGTAVTLIGRDETAFIGADELAAACGTIAYEIVARLPAGVPRCYDEALSAASASRKSSVPS